MNEPAARKSVREASEQLISFMIGSEEFAIDLRKVREVLTCPEITRLPRSPEFVLGVIDLRGEIIPVIDMGAKLGLRKWSRTPLSAVIIVETEQRQIGAIVDRIGQVIRLTSDQLTPPVRMADGVSEEFVRGMGKLADRLIVILETSKIFSPRETRDLAALSLPPQGNEVNDA